MDDSERLAAINALLDSFTTSGRDEGEWLEPEEQGKRWITVHDHQFLDTEFFDRLFDILDR